MDPTLTVLLHFINAFKQSLKYYMTLLQGMVLLLTPLKSLSERLETDPACNLYLSSHKGNSIENG
ncbi:hypothetical protein TVAG_168220 [Trichomonas vaginalis G3]|uniref:Uncharacterized protein n=1 Tax=Trichomonas vaginalis (strain ATCC PRA-98 / G3) TaxID=412133 RepID=A2FBJ0_TRIV3|nr:hypothetical protein TVAGG3_0129750 [Trichomonas vaginalis G3]EAX97725.1 hypothetical protein TVAG_168220 [Trichomonas vaginalis G3]KAI5546018.1 hypothetical protein TVAGG3_0129750 [Trichomonas vaginalis G3]|eukprot:XP_001310655.1 hypothetical protein [Trichomonas vaginalis G3]